MLDGTDPSAVRDPDHDRERQLPHRARSVLGEVRCDLLERRIRETVELHLADRLEPVDRQADPRSDDARLRERCVDDALLAKLLLELVGDTEHAAGLADVLTQDDDAIVALHAIAQGLVQTLRERDRGHYRPSWSRLKSSNCDSRFGERSW